ncbi:MAG: DNA-directed RNA polymerase subunit omega [Thermodesulfobacteriota bacterium]
MARVTVEDCLLKVDNRFQLVHLAARRVRQLRGGAKPMSDRDNKDVVLSLREIAQGDINVHNIDENEPHPQEDLEVTEVIDDSMIGENWE